MDSKKAIIFGATGQDGRYLRDLLLEKGWEVAPFDADGEPALVDVADASAVDRWIRTHRPARIFHFAARSTTSLDAGTDNFRAIALGAWNILASAWKHVPRSRVLIAGSGLQFLNRGRPIREEDPFDPSSPYAVARIAAVQTARYFRRLGLRAYVGYLFHHESPRRRPEQMSRRIAAAAAGKMRGSLFIGDGRVRKEWAYAGDIVRGMWALISQTRVMEACIGTGKAYSIEDWVRACFAVHQGDWRKKIVMGRNGFVPEYRSLVSHPRRIFSLGWRPRVSLNQLARLMVEAERTGLGSQR